MLPASTRQHLDRLQRSGIKLGLERMKTLLAALGAPHRELPTVLVAGTNGKGSTAALLSSVLRRAGYRAGLYTSPHLEDVEERLRIDGRVVPGPVLASLVEEILEVSRQYLQTEPTYFECLTTAAFCHFARHGADLAVMEVGLGGRLDATNVAEPILSLVSSISFDHQEYLGDNLALIAREKAGILRRHTPALAWIEEREAAESLEDCARSLGTPLVMVNEEASVEPLDESGIPQRIRLHTPSETLDLELPLPGRHQWGNVALAVRAAQVLRDRGWSRLDSASIRDGVARCRWPGRLERISIPGVRPLLLDAAHNPQGVRAALCFMEQEESFDLLFGALADKPVASMLPPLSARARHVLLTAPDNPRSSRPHALLPWAPAERSAVMESPAHALQAALEADPPLLVCGSIYLVGEVRRLLRERFGSPAAAGGVI